MNQKLHWTFSSFIFVVLVAFISYSSFYKSKKVVYVDAVKLVSNYEGMKAAQTELKSKYMIYQQNIDTLKKELNAKTTEYSQKRTGLSNSERKLFEEVLAAKEQQLGAYQQMVDEKMQNENLQLTQKVLDRVNDYIKRYGNDHGYELILAATQSGNIIYGTPDVNITEQVLVGLNLEYGKIPSK